MFWIWLIAFVVQGSISVFSSFKISTKSNYFFSWLIDYSPHIALL